MKSFHVWIRSLGSTCRVRVDGMQNARWLLSQLGRSFAFKTAEPIDEETGSSCCTFFVAYTSRVSRRGLEKLLEKIPEVVLMSDPA
jgi:hypothetical protein